jgi:hypothetical protein
VTAALLRCAIRVPVTACCVTHLDGCMLHPAPLMRLLWVPSGWQPMQVAVQVNGSLDAREGSRGWTVEMALPWSLLRHAASRQTPPSPGACCVCARAVCSQRQQHCVLRVRQKPRERERVCVCVCGWVGGWVCRAPSSCLPCLRAVHPPPPPPRHRQATSGASTSAGCTTTSRGRRISSAT